MTRVTKTTTFLLVCALAQISHAADKDQVLSFVDERYDETARIARTLWEYAEVGYQETKSSSLLQQTLNDEGFSIDAGVADIPTAFVASYGSGKPVIGILAEFDALPGINQDSVAARSPIPGKVPAMPAATTCWRRLRQCRHCRAPLLEDSGNRGTIRVYGTPAEEGGSGKVYMVRAGLFDDVDTVLHWHAGDENSASATRSLANRSAKFRFHGVSAHAAGAPENARSALDGVEAFNHMVNLMREHVPMETRIHYVITAGGNAPNVVPDFAEVFYYVRHPDAAIVKEIWVRLEAAAEGAALGTGTRVEAELIHGNHSVQVNETLAKMMDEKLREVGGITYTPEEQAFAEEIYQSLNNPKLELGSQADVQPYSVGTGFHSTDVGDVSIAVPTVGLSTATWVPGTSAHSWQSTAASGMTIGYKGALVASKTLSLAAIELFENSDLRAQARVEHEKQVGSDFHYEALLGDRPPPLDYRK